MNLISTSYVDYRSSCHGSFERDIAVEFFKYIEYAFEYTIYYVRRRSVGTCSLASVWCVGLRLTVIVQDLFQDFTNSAAL